jgi:hypothetical protein
MPYGSGCEAEDGQGVTYARQCGSIPRGRRNNPLRQKRNFRDWKKASCGIFILRVRNYPGRIMSWTDCTDSGLKKQYNLTFHDGF